MEFPSGLYKFLPRRLVRTLHFIFDITLSCVFLAIGRSLPSLRHFLSEPTSRLSGRTAVVTGSNSGIGLQIALDLTSLGARVILACRNVNKAEEAKAYILSHVPDASDRLTVMSLDTSSFDSVREFCDNWKNLDYTSRTIDILVHNAGIAKVPSTAQSDYSTDGFELTYATNFLGSFLLTYLLDDCLSEDARVILTSSTGQYGGQISKEFALNSRKNQIEPGFHASKAAILVQGDSPNGSDRYSQTKAMQAAFARCLQQRFDQRASLNGLGARKIAHCFSPGFTSTPIFDKFEAKSLFQEPLFAILRATTGFATDVSEGAATGTWLAVTQDPSVVKPGNGGRYFDRCVARLSSTDLLDQETLDRLWIRWQADAAVEWL